MHAAEDLVRSIKKKLKSGYPEGEVRNELLEKGHTEEDIKRLISIASGCSDKLARTTSRHNSGASIFYLAGVALLITGITIMSANTWLKKYGLYLLIASVVCFMIGINKAVWFNRNNIK